ncbi:hypothetical protein ENSA5_16820 [Enhygromyxa salina]|uniref:Uncharacterized protein n=1 Tax=Enhygromyxa salina TaxID=215803 RepID=A0A2S9YE78_9BACT|nr:hypothetical protein ENSA5_16820 [Enhygromyxa salina]
MSDSPAGALPRCSPDPRPEPGSTRCARSACGTRWAVAGPARPGASARAWSLGGAGPWPRSAWPRAALKIHRPWPGARRGPWPARGEAAPRSRPGPRAGRARAGPVRGARWRPRPGRRRRGARPRSAPTASRRGRRCRSAGRRPHRGLAPETGRRCGPGAGWCWSRAGHRAASAQARDRSRRRGRHRRCRPARARARVRRGTRPCRGRPRAPWLPGRRSPGFSSSSPGSRVRRSGRGPWRPRSRAWRGTGGRRSLRRSRSDRRRADLRPGPSRGSRRSSRVRVDG